MEEFLKLAEKLASVGFGTLLFLILVGSRFEVWFWGKDVIKLVEQHKEAIQKEREQTEFWRSIAIKVTGIAEATTRVSVKN